MINVQYKGTGTILILCRANKLHKTIIWKRVWILMEGSVLFHFREIRRNFVKNGTMIVGLTLSQITITCCMWLHQIATTRLLRDCGQLSQFSGETVPFILEAAVSISAETRLPMTFNLVLLNLCVCVKFAVQVTQSNYQIEGC